MLSSLLVTCALVPAIEALSARIRTRRTGQEAPAPPTDPIGRRLTTAIRNPVLVAVTLIAVGGVVNTALLARDKSIVLIEREMTPRKVQ